MNLLPVDIDGYKLFEAVGVWAAAFSTLIAAYVALKIARKQDEIRLVVFVTAAQFIGQGPITDIVWIRIFNVARRTATVLTIGWRLSSFSKAEFFQPVSPPNPTPPFVLTDGEEVSLELPVERLPSENWYDDFAEMFLKYGEIRRWFELKSLRLIVSCSTGENFKVAPDKRFIEHVKRAIKRRQGSTK